MFFCVQGKQDFIDGSRFYFGGWSSTGLWLCGLQAGRDRIYGGLPAGAGDDVRFEQGDVQGVLGQCIVFPPSDVL